MIRLRIKEVLDQHPKMNMAKLSRRADISYNTIQNLCSDPFHDFNKRTIEKIARALKVSAFELIEEVPDENVEDDDE